MTVFETGFCTRCGGSGRYSYNQIDGDRCYGCYGTGLRLTARGKAARARYNESLRKPIADLRPGMLVWDDTHGYKPCWLPILAIQTSKSCLVAPDGSRVPFTEIRTKRSGLHMHPAGTVRAVASDEERQALIAAALEYQSTLSKSGKPLKRQPVTTGE